MSPKTRPAAAGTRVSDYYKLGRGQASLEFVDVELDQDTPLFVDPRAFVTLRSAWGDSCTELIRDFFNEVLAAIRNDDEQRALLLLGGLHEPKETRLGYTDRGVSGTGIGAVMAVDLYDSLSRSKAVRADGLIEDLEDASLLISGIGADRVSDIATNIVRRKLIEFTVATSKRYGMNLVDNVPSGALWSPEKGLWEQQSTRLLCPDDKPLLLVPRVVARRRANYDPGEYYRHYVLPFLQEREIANPTSALAWTVRSGPNKGQRRVFKKAIEQREKREYGGGSKSISERNTVEYPEILDRYRAAKRGRYLPPESIAFLANQVGIPDADWDGLLKAVKECKPGKAHATKYHRAIEALLTALFEPSLVDPQLEQNIAGATKRIDIRYTNMATDGFFWWFQESHAKAPWVVVECKNYASDPKNPEVAQLAGRLSQKRGLLGLMTCRKIQNRAVFLTRCREELNNASRFIIGLDDDILTDLVEARKSGDGGAFRRRLTDLVGELID